MYFAGSTFLAEVLKEQRTRRCAWSRGHFLRETLEVYSVVCQLYPRFIHIYETVQHRWLPLQQALHSHELKLRRLQRLILPDFTSLQIGKSEECSGRGKEASGNMHIENDQNEWEDPCWSPCHGSTLHCNIGNVKIFHDYQDLRNSYHKPGGSHTRNRHAEGWRRDNSCWMLIYCHILLPLGWSTSNLFGYIFCYVQIEFNIGISMTPCIRLNFAESQSNLLDKTMMEYDGI